MCQYNNIISAILQQIVTAFFPPNPGSKYCQGIEQPLITAALLSNSAGFVDDNRILMLSLCSSE